MGNRQWFVLYVLVCLEVGFFLMLVPWSSIWERNYFLEAFPTLRPYILSPALKGAVCGLGLANIYLGVTEILNRLRVTQDARDAFELGESELDEPAGGANPGATKHERTATNALAAPEER